MRKFLFPTDKVKAAILPGTKRVSALVARYRKFSFGSAAILAMLAAPFAVQAMVPAFAGEGSQGEPDPIQQVEESTTEVKPPVEGSQRTEVKADADSGTSASNDAEVDITVNGRKIPVPRKGSVHKRMTNNSNNSKTTVDIQVDSSSSSQSSSSSSTDVSVDHHSYTENFEDEGSDW